MKRYIPFGLSLVLQVCATLSAEPKRVITSCGITFIEIPAGTFVMGSPTSDPLRVSNEDSVNVTLSKFWMSETEVSWRQWMEIFGSGGPEAILQRPLAKDEIDLPVTGIAYFGLRSFFKMLTTRLGNDKVLPAGEAFLPTEAQWEYVARSGVNGVLDEKAIESLLIDSRENIGSLNEGEDNVMPCGTGRANRYGCKDMFGNVKELCRDVYLHKLLGGVNPAVTSCSDVWNLKLVLRGGAFNSEVRSCRFSHRDFVCPDRTANTIGFRVVWETRTRR
jgi:formylglycine-generating enzyme required for sulfatase activity